MLELLDNPQNDHYVPYKTLIDRAKQLLNATKVEVDNAIVNLSKLRLIHVETDTDEQNRQVKKSIQILNPDTLTTVAGTYYETMTKKNREREIGEIAFLDVTDLANKIGVSEERILNRMRSGEIPSDLIYFHKASLEKWLSQKTRESFD